MQVKGPQDLDYQTIGTTSMTSIEYQDSQEGVYDFRVRAKALNGKTSAWMITQTEVDRVKAEMQAAS